MKPVREMSIGELAAFVASHLRASGIDVVLTGGSCVTIHGRVPLDTFLEDRKTQDAVVRNLEVIGQALKDYGIDVLNEKKPYIPWAKIAGMRNILAHDYLGVDMVMIWDTVHLHLNELHQALEDY